MEPQFSDELLDRIQQCGVIAVLVVEDLRHAIPVARALLDGGVDVMELTLRTPVAVEALRAIRGNAPEMLAGMGTILTPQQVQQVAAAGATFGVAPGTNPRVIRAAQEIGLPFAPGVVTPSDVETSLELGCRQLKYFPAEPSGGLAYLKSLAAPFAHLGVRFVPLGGLTTSNLESYLAEPTVLAVGGSWLASQQLMYQEDWAAITRNAGQARELVDQFRAAAGP